MWNKRRLRLPIQTGCGRIYNVFWVHNNIHVQPCDHMASLPRRWYSLLQSARTNLLSQVCLEVALHHHIMMLEHSRTAHKVALQEYRYILCVATDHTHTGRKYCGVLGNSLLHKFIPFDKPHIPTQWKPPSMFSPGVILGVPVSKPTITMEAPHMVTWTCNICFRICTIQAWAFQYAAFQENQNIIIYRMMWVLIRLRNVTIAG
jgi:hypothetical protein